MDDLTFPKATESRQIKLVRAIVSSFVEAVLGTTPFGGKLKKGRRVW